MGRLEDINILLTSPPMDKSNLTFEQIYHPCKIYNFLSIEDIQNLYAIATDKKLNTKPKEKLNMIKVIMARRGFKRLSSGTNRIVFKYLEDQSFVFKIAYDSVGLSDNLNEMYNQNLIKPFCTKVFDVTPCGTVGMFERVHAIRNREEFYNIAADIYDIIVNEFIGKYVLADFGTKFFMNWGIREGQFPVILDFPYIYELDGAKMYCNRPDPNSKYGFCGGEIDYDDGFNHLVCTKCGKTFMASELKLVEENKSSSINIERKDLEMVVKVIKDDRVIQTVDSSRETDTYKKDKKGRRKETPLEYRERRKYLGFGVNIVKGSTEVVEDENKYATEKFDNQITPDQCNTGWGTKNVPTLDGLFKDDSIQVRDRNGNVVGSEETPSDKEERIRDIIDNTLNIISKIEDSVDNKSSDEIETEEDYTEEKKMIEIIPRTEEELSSAKSVEEQFEGLAEDFYD